jgi:WD40 repeat protein
MESQDNHHHPPEHTFQETGSADREENTRVVPTATAILKRLRLGRPSQLPEMDETQLLIALENSEWQKRVAAVQKLEEYRESAPIERLFNVLNDEHEAVRAAAAHALGVLSNPQAVTPLVEALQDPIWLVRAAVVQALGMLGEQAPVEPLVHALNDEDESVRVVAVRTLATLGERVPTKSLLATLQDGAWQVREIALLALGIRGGDIPKTAFAQALQDVDESVRRAAHFLQESYPDRFAETAISPPVDNSEKSIEDSFDAQIHALPQAASSADQQDGKQEEPGNELLRLDDEHSGGDTAQYRVLRRYPRRGAQRNLRLALLFCWSIFFGYLVGIIWNLVQLTHVDPAQLTTRVAIQILSTPLTALEGLNVPVWIRGVCVLLALLLFFGCLWATRDAWYERRWAPKRGVSREEVELGSREHDQFARAPVDSLRQVSPATLHSRRAVLVGLTTVLIVGNSIAWSLLLNGRRKKDSSRLALGTVLYIYRRNTGNVRAVAWSPESTRIASGNDDRTVQVWVADDGSNSFTYSRHTSAVLTVSWSPDGSRIASAGDDGNVQVWDASTDRTVLTYRGHVGDTVVGVSWSPDGTRIVSAGSGGSKIQVWNAANGGHIFTFFAFATNGALTVAWSPDGSRIASAGDDGNVYIWDATTGRAVFTNTFGIPHGFQKSDPINSLAWSPDSTRIASGSDGKTVQVWDASNGEQVYTYRGHYNAPLGFVTAVAWSPDGTRIASGSDDKTVQVWDASDGGHAYIYRGHANMVTTVAWSPDGTHIASGGYDKTVQIWGAG